MSKKPPPTHVREKRRHNGTSDTRSSYHHHHHHPVGYIPTHVHSLTASTGAMGFFLILATIGEKEKVGEWKEI